MCGFVGRILSDLEAIERAPAIEASLQFLRRRGPDSWSAWSAARSVRGGRVQLLHARLAIVDPDPIARQPFTAHDGAVTLAFNGEIYNYPELRETLPDYPFRSRSDTEVIVAVYQREGVEGLRRLRGMFALALVDEPRGVVVLARDAVGKKPIYVMTAPGEIRFGSSSLALASMGAGEAPLASDAPAHFWARGQIAATRSVFAHCEPLRPGEVRVYDFAGVEVVRTDCRPMPRPAPPTASVADAIAETARLLEMSVARRLRDNPCKTVLLSGGVDSTVVSMLAARQVPGVVALTLGQLIPLDMDERYARYAAWKLGLPLKVLKPAIGRLEDEVVWSLGLQDEPLGMLSFFPLSLLLRAAKDHGKIILTGDGGDEAFLGYGKPADWTVPETAAPDSRGPGASPVAPGLEVGPALPPWMSAWGRQAVTEELVAHNFAKLDRASAEQGIETRSPLLDWDLLALARGLTPAQLLASGTPKSLLKAQLSGWPRWFVERPKIGFGYRLRWMWGLRRYAGLREHVVPEALAAFAPHLPPALRKPAHTWPSRAIFQNFEAAWKVLVWSRFLERRRAAVRASVAGASAAR